MAPTCPLVLFWKLTNQPIRKKKTNQPVPYDRQNGSKLFCNELDPIMQTIGVLLAVELSCLMNNNKLEKTKPDLDAKTGRRLHSQQAYKKWLVLKSLKPFAVC
jgi:hypothetical protein